MCHLFFAVACLLAGPKTSLEVMAIPPEWPASVRAAVEEYAAAAEDGRDDEIAGAEYQLSLSKKIKPKSVRDRENKAAQIEYFTDRLKKLKAGVLLPEVTLEVTEAKKGMLGRPTCERAEIRGEAIQILKGKVIVEVPAPSRSRATIIIYGLDTENLIDGAEIPMTSPLRCIGPQSFTTVSGGNRTLMAFEVLPITEKLEEWERLRLKAYTEANAKPVKK